MSNLQTMGAWGAGLFSDDTAADVRVEYRDYLADGMDGRDATDKLLAQFRDSQDDPDVGPPFWLALASTQARYGRLEDRVRDRALQIIDDGSDLSRFAENPKLARTRERVLQKLRAQLTGPQREPAKVRPEVPSECDWEAGEVVGFERTSGEWIPLHVQGIGESRRSRYPTVCVLKLSFDRVDVADEHTPVRRVFTAPRRFRQPPGAARLGPCPDCFTIFGMKKRDLSSSRTRRTGKVIVPRVQIKGDGILVGSKCLMWRYLDYFLDDYLE